VGDFYGTGIEIWARFGPIGSTEKKGLGLLGSTFEGVFFHVFRGKKMLQILKRPKGQKYFYGHFHSSLALGTFH
jgi:hypothetical protein